MKINKHLPLVLVIILSIMTMPFSNKALALSCVPATLEEQISGTSVIFSGKVTSVQTATSEKAANASFDVTEYWKGQVDKKMTIGGIYAWTGSVNPPPFFKIGDTYLVFARSVPDSGNAKNIPNNLIATIDCSRTKLLIDATEEINALGEGKKPVDMVSTKEIIPAIPPATRPVSGETNYQKCLNKAILKREKTAKNTYQEFNLAVETERVALERVARPFRGWLAWLNIFRREDVKSFEKLNKEYVKALEKATPAKEMAIQESNDRFEINKQYCLTHQNTFYEWTPEDQRMLEQFVPPRSKSGSKGDISK